MNVTRNPGQIARSRGVGSRVGTLIGAGWMAYALSSCPNMVRVGLGLPALAVVWLLLNRSGKLLARSRGLPAPDPGQRAAHRRVWRWFWWNLLGEIVLLNVAVNLLAAPPLHVYWVPAISAVVGLHFLPMARFFAVPSYWLCGGAMMLAAAAAALEINAHPASAVVFTAAEAALNACFLWAMVAWGTRSLPRSDPGQGGLQNG